MALKSVIIFCAFLICLSANIGWASPKTPLRIGYIGSLSGFAAAYGQAVLNGVTVAIDELKASGQPIELRVEDDKSSPKDLVTAYMKLKSVDKIDALITGTWWADSIVKKAEADSIPFISCETMYGKDFIQAPNYFSLLGDWRNWILVFRPLVEKNNWKKASMIKFISGAADTMRDEMQRMFSGNGRLFLKPVEYSDFEMKEATTIAAQVRAMAPDVLYVDGQPSSFGNMINKLIDQKVSKLVVFTNAIALDAYREKLFDPKRFPGEIYFSARSTYRPSFVKAYQGKYGREPELNSDLGYYAMYLLDKAFASGYEPVTALKSGKLQIDGITFSFDEHNVYSGIGQEVFTFRDGLPVKVLGSN